jgi:hypothetical protein
MDKAKNKKINFTVPGAVLAIILALIVLLLGWYVANIIQPLTPDTKNTSIYSSTANRQYLIYRTYRVLSRGTQEWPNDDLVAYEFFRYPLDGAARRGENIFRVDRTRIDSDAGTPWMQRVSETILLFARRELDPTEAVWVDVSGKKLHSTENKPADVIWNGLPSPDGQKIAYYNWTNRRVVVFQNENFPTEYDLGDQAFEPLAWDRNSINLYLNVVAEGEQPIAELWRLNTATGSAEEITAIRKLGLYNIDLNTEVGRLVGVTDNYNCRGSEDCKAESSSLYLVDLFSGKSIELQTEKHLFFIRPRLSPNADKVAYILSNGQNDVWISDLDIAGHEQRIISGQLLDWLPNGEGLIVDRDNELQLVSIEDDKIITVARRSGQYSDQDFVGVDYVGIIGKQ